MPRIDKSKTLQAAQKHLGKGNLRKALEEYLKILQVDSGNTNIRLKTAELLERLGDVERAACEYRRVARDFKAGGFYPKACALFTRVAALEPESADAHLELAELNQKLGRVAEALRHYQQATDVEDRGRDKRHSIDILKRIAEVGAPNFDRSLEVANLYYKEGFEQEGFEQFFQATADLDQTSDEVLEITLSMRLAWPEDLRLKARLGEVHLARSEAKEAATLFEEIVASARNARNLVLLAEARVQEQELEEAKALYQEAIALYEADWDVEKRRDISARLIEISASLLESATGEILLTELEDDRPAASNGTPEDTDSDEMRVQAVAESVDDESSTLAGLRIGVEDLDTLLTEADAFLSRGNHTVGIEILERAADLHPSEKAPLCRLQTIHEECADWAALAEVNRRLASVPTLGGTAPCDDPPSSIPATVAIHGEDPEVLAAPDSPLLSDAPASSAVEPGAAGETIVGDFDIQIVIDEKEMGATGEQAKEKETGFRSALTGLPLRDLFLDRVDRAIARKDRIKSYKFAVLVLDIDRFKRINDEFGLHRADEMLVEVAQRLEKCLRKSDTAAYLDGDEFGILLENLRGEQDAIRLARKITRQLSSPFELDGREVEISASIGVALSATGYDRPEKLLQDAEAAMFRAKANGGGSTELFDESLRTRAVALLELETNLRRAIEAGEFLIHYQPIVALGSGRVVGFEALARWQHPGGNLIAPNEFIPMAEEIDLIGPIEKWLIGEACRQLGEWQSNHPDEVPLTMNVNVSGKHLAQESFVGHLEDALSKSGIEQGTLIFEVTENALIENAGALPALMPKLEALRVRLSVDDFGSGLSSLSLLQRYPLAALKIDAVRAADGGAGFEGPGFFGADMIRALISLARILGADSVVKNVEREEQLAELRETGCDHAQGHLFSRAVDNREASGLIGETLPRTPPVES